MSSSMDHMELLGEERSGNNFFRPMLFAKRGEVVNGHKHNFDHTTFVNRGGIFIEQLDEQGTVIKSAIKHAYDRKPWVLIKAGVIHRITALEDNTNAFCVYSFREPDGTIVPEWNGWYPATE